MHKGFGTTKVEDIVFINLKVDRLVVQDMSTAWRVSSHFPSSANLSVQKACKCK